MKDLQTVLDALIALTEHACACNEATGEIWGDGVTAIAIVKEMMQVEPVAYRVRVETKLHDGSVSSVYQYRKERCTKFDEPLFAAPQAVPEGWIPVAERQPEPEVAVLCYGPNTIDATLPWRIFTDWCGSRKDFGLGVTHWMPLPAAPNGGVQVVPAETQPTHKTTGWMAHRDQYAVPVLFNPYTGEPRDVRDVQSDPQGILIVPPGKVETLAAPQAVPAVEQGVIAGLQVTVTALLREVDAGWSPDARSHLLKLDTTIAMLAAAPKGAV